MGLAFSPDGSRLASGGADGSLRIWDVAQGAAVAFRAGNPNLPNPINSLAYSPDGVSIVVGLEAPGRLFLFQAADVGGVAPVRLPTLDGQGPVECLAYHPDARRPRLAVSIKSDASPVPDPMRMSCDIEIRDMPAGAVVHRRRVAGLVYALAFSPDGGTLAYAGGPAQAIQIVDLAALDGPPREIRGAGSTPFDVRFSGDGKVVGFTRTAFDPANPPASYEGFELERREPVTVTRNDLPHGTIQQYQGWSLQRSDNPIELAAVDATGQRRLLAIERRLERQAWSSTFIPGAASHPRATVAIGTESGVAVFDFETGARTRVYAGHSSPVVSLAPSRDGRWLASSSLDQTVLLYPLDDCDSRPLLGATVRVGPGGDWTVDAVDRQSFAAAMGLLPADILLEVGIGWGESQKKYHKTPAEIDEFFRTLPQMEPFLYTIGIVVRRTLPIPPLGFVTYEAVLPTTRRNNPALALFLGTDREWVLWTPQGYYDTSIEGDARFLGWHINPPFQTSRPTDFVPIGAFADAMNRRDVLDRLWRSGVVDQVAIAPPVAPAVARAAEVRQPTVVAAEDQPPRIVFAPIQGGTQLPAPGVLWVVDRPDVKVSLRISASGRSEIGKRRIVLDERPMPLNENIGPAGDFSEDVPLSGLVPNRRVRLAAEATNTAGGQRTETIDIVYLPPAKPAAPAVGEPSAPGPPRLHVLAIGCDRFAAGLPPLDYAGRDAETLAGWLADHLTSADGARNVSELPVVLVGAKASFQSITEACDHLHDLVANKRVRDRDIVAVVIASYLLASPDGVVIAAADTVASNPPRTAFAASDLSEVLGQLTEYGCRVVVFLDGLHKVEEPSRSEIKPFVRELLRKRGVITFIASNEGPSGVDRPREHGVFALGVTQVFLGADLAGVRKDRSDAYTLDQFRTALRNEVFNLSARRQQASCYIPTRVPERTLFARPRN